MKYLYGFSLIFTIFHSLHSNAETDTNAYNLPEGTTTTFNVNVGNGVFYNQHLNAQLQTPNKDGLIDKDQYEFHTILGPSVIATGGRPMLVAPALSEAEFKQVYRLPKGAECQYYQNDSVHICFLQNNTK